jgi:hypothetical protein
MTIESEIQAEPQAQTPRLTDDQMERLRSVVEVAFVASRSTDDCSTSISSDPSSQPSLHVARYEDNEDPFGVFL